VIEVGKLLKGMNQSDEISKGLARTKSAMLPILWIILMLVPLVSISIFIGGTSLLISIITTLFAASVLVGLAAYVYFGLKDPDRLQSEEYQFKKHTLAYIRERGESPMPTIEVGMANPVLMDQDESEKGEAE